MTELIKRTLSGAVFVACMVGSILWSPYAITGVLLLICLMAEDEFHRLVKSARALRVYSFLATVISCLMVDCFAWRIEGSETNYHAFGIILVQVVGDDGPFYGRGAEEGGPDGFEGTLPLGDGVGGVGEPEGGGVGNLIIGAAVHINGIRCLVILLLAGSIDRGIQQHPGFRVVEQVGLAGSQVRFLQVDDFSIGIPDIRLAIDIDDSTGLGIAIPNDCDFCDITT